MQNVLRLAALVAVVQFLEVKCGHVPPPSVVVRSRGDTTASPHSPSASSEDASSPSFLTLIACRGGSAAAPSAVPTSAAASAPSPTPGPPPASWASTGFMRPSKRIDDQGFLREVSCFVGMLHRLHAPIHCALLLLCWYAALLAHSRAFF